MLHRRHKYTSQPLLGTASWFPVCPVQGLGQHSPAWPNSPLVPTLSPVRATPFLIYNMGVLLMGLLGRF